MVLIVQLHVEIVGKIDVLDFVDVFGLVVIMIGYTVVCSVGVEVDVFVEVMLQSQVYSTRARIYYVLERICLHCN